jgi:threonine dehydratase
MSHDWNISLFHYRNHGSALGRVLIGMQVPPEDQVAFQTFLDKMGYVYCNESDNLAYHLFVNGTA